MKTRLGMLVAACVAAPGVAAGPFAPSAERGPFAPSASEGFFMRESMPQPNEAQEKAAERCTKRAASGLVWPLCRKADVTTRFNETTSRDKYPADNGVNKRHLGVDYRSRFGETVYSPVDGTVRRISTGGSWGTNREGKYLSAVVIVADEAGPLGARFWVLGHVDASVKEGDKVRAGDKVGVATLATDHHTHVGVGAGTTVPNDRLGRQDESRIDVTPFIDAEEVLSYDWKKEAIAELERSRKKLKFPVHTRESACKGELRVSDQCWQRRYDPPNAKTWYTLVADAEERETLLCVKDRYRDCIPYDKEW